jgi:hypothetical protein
MGYLGNQITTVFPTSISVDSATISGNASVGGTLGVTGVSTLSDNIVFDASNKGVHLGVTSATASNLLDDYEEGTWTPSITAYYASTGTQPTVTFAGAAASGYYNKVGRLVSVSFAISNFTVSGTTSGIMNISGLPFANSSDWNGGVLSHYNVTFARGSNGNMSLRTFGTTSLGILSTDNGGLWNWELVSIFSSSSANYIAGSITYQADA